MAFRIFKRGSVAGNARTLNIFSFWFCLRFFNAVAVIYYAQVTHSYALAISVFVIAQVAQAVLEVPTGIVSDRLGRVVCLRVGAVASCLSLLCFTGGSYGWLVAGALLVGLWRALFSGNNEALLYESAKQTGSLGKFHTYLGQMNVAMEVGGFLAMIAGGILAAVNMQWVLWLTAAAQVPAFAISFWLVDAHIQKHQAPSVWRHFREALGYMRRNATLRRLSLGQIIGGGFSTFELWPAFYNTVVPVWAVGAMMSVNYLESAIGFQLSGGFLKRFKPIAIMLWGDVYARILMIGALVFPTVLSPALMAVAGAPYGPSTVAQGTLLHQEFTDHQRATMASITSLLSNCVYAIFALGIGLIADRYGARAAILLGQICLLPGLWLYVLVRRDQRRG